MKRITIDDFIRAMRAKQLTRGVGELEGEKIRLDLDNLRMALGNVSYDLDRIPGKKGGYRYFFLCPNCDKRCRVFYKRHNFYSCGTCQEVYKSTLNRSKTDCQYYWERALREARKVVPNWSPRRGGYMFENFPDKPKRMRWETYWRHRKRFVNYVRKGDSYWLNGLR